MNNTLLFQLFRDSKVYKTENKNSVLLKLVNQFMAFDSHFPREH